MHELSLIRDILDVVLQHAKGKKLRSIRLHVGKLAGVEIQALRFGFDVCAKGTLAEEDKPLKYPHVFRTADLILLTKIDLLPHLDYDLPRALQAIQTIRPDAQVLQVSARSGEGMDRYAWLEQE